jgi:TPR repeat protein
MRYESRMRATLIVVFTLQASSGFVCAGPLEDARATYLSGDYATAFKGFRVLADQGSPVAQTNLGVMYGSGEGVPQSFTEAFKWFHKAADQGDAGAQYNLGLLYRDGKGVPRNYVLAYMWFELAISAFPTSKYESRKSAYQAREFVAFKMTTAQIAKAQKLAQEWKPKGGQ